MRRPHQKQHKLAIEDFLCDFLWQFPLGMGVRAVSSKQKQEPSVDATLPKTCPLEELIYGIEVVLVGACSPTVLN